MDRNDNAKTIRIDLLPDVAAELPLRRDVSAPVRSPEQPSSASLPNCCRELLQGLYDGAVLCEPSGRITEANDRALEFLKYDHGELCQRSILDVIAGADAQLLNTIQENLRKQRFTLIQAYCHRRDGSAFPAEIVISQFTHGGLRLAFFLRDISVRRDEEEQLRTEHAALQNAANGVAITDQSGHIMYVNPALAHMWDYPRPDQLSARPITELFAQPALAGQTISTCLNVNESWTGELMARRRSGEEFTVQVSAALNRNANDDLVGLIFSFLDVSDRQRATRAQQEAERQRVMIESFGTACHHLGQPATVLLANLDLLRQELANAPETTRQLLDDALRGAEAIREMLQKLNTAVVYRPTPYSSTATAPSPDRPHIIEI